MLADVKRIIANGEALPDSEKTYASNEVINSILEDGEWHAGADVLSRERVQLIDPQDLGDEEIPVLLVFRLYWKNLDYCVTGKYIRNEGYVWDAETVEPY